MHRRASRLHNRLKVSWLGTPFLNRRSLLGKSCSALGQRPSHLLLSGRNLAALGPAQGGGGKMDASTSVLPNRKNYPKYKIAFDIHQGISDEYQQN
jgi:hypothetical protein